MTVWRKAADLRPGSGQPDHWLVAIARNRSIDRLRAERQSPRMRPIEDAVDVRDAAPGALAQVETGEEHAAAERLPGRARAAPRQRDPRGVPRRRDLRGLAERMNVPLGTMKSWIRRSLMRLRTAWNDERRPHHSPPDDGTPLAAEYVLGVLDAEQRRAFEQRLEAGARASRRSRILGERLGALAAEVAPVEPPPQIWTKIEAALPRRRRRRSAGGSGIASHSGAGPRSDRRRWRPPASRRWSGRPVTAADARRWSPSSTSAADRPASSPRSTRRATA